MAVTEIVETGTGISGANTYAIATVIGSYWANQPHRAEAVAWAAADSETQKGAGIEASAYLDAAFGPHYRGQRSGYVQGLLWPRVNAKDEAGYPLPNLPPQIVTAVCELAGRAVTEVLSADDAADRVTSERFGGVSFSYKIGRSREKKYGFVAGLIAQVLDGTQPDAPSPDRWAWA